MPFPYASQTKTVVGTTAAYAANQVIGTGIQNFQSIPPQGFIQTVQINLNSTNANQIDFCTFNSSMPNTTFTNASSIAISSADASSMGPIASVVSWNYMGTNAAVGMATGLSMAYPSQTGNAPMYWALVARGAVTLNSTNGITVTVTFVS